MENKALLIFFFHWCLHQGVNLKNIATLNWHGSNKYCFFYKDETITHLFFLAIVPNPTWYGLIIEMGSSGLSKPRSTLYLFENWLRIIKKECEFSNPQSSTTILIEGSSSGFVYYLVRWQNEVISYAQWFVYWRCFPSACMAIKSQDCLFFRISYFVSWLCASS